MTGSTSILPPAKIAIVGLGNMGQPMAACLSRAGYQVRGFDTSADARTKFSNSGGNATTTVVEAVSDGYKAPDVLTNALRQYRNEARTIDYLLLSNANIDPVKAPGDSTYAT